MARVARACGFGIGGLRFRGCPRFVPHSTDPANPAKSHEPPNLPDLPDLPKRRALPNRHPVRGGAKHRFETKTRVPKRSAALALAKQPAMSQPAFRMGLPRYRPQAAPRLAARVPGVSDERPNLPKPKACAPQSPCLQVPAMPSQSPRALFIPACAGNRCPRAWWLIAMSVHPRVCGEQARMARASCTLPQTVHPRVCGEQDEVIAPYQDFGGSSPRVRGTGSADITGSSLISVHPRVCGEQDRPAELADRFAGSSPRVRGTGALNQPDFALIRFIPACAGNSSRVELLL